MNETELAEYARKKGLYVVLYHLMDYVTAVCPAVRWYISEQFGMKAVQNRKKQTEAKRS